MGKRKKQQVSRFNFTWRPSFIGLWFGLLFFAASMLPSLLPRPWYIQGIISALSIAIGYGIGLAVSSLLRWFIQREVVGDVHKRKSWNVTKVLIPTAVVVFLLLGVRWQVEVYELLDLERSSGAYALLVFITTIFFTAIFYFIGRGIRRIGRTIYVFSSKKVPLRVSVAIALFGSFAIVNFAISGLLFSGMLSVADNIFSLRDNTAPDGIVQPESLYKSGSDESLIPWEDIGFQGRGFVASGPTQQDIESYSGDAAVEPIRIYAGLASAPTAEERARLALEDLKRTDAFEREVLVIANATGTGWLDPPVMDSIEYMYGGDTAIVSQQYSYLPSWISFLVDQERARETGRVLYDTILEELTAMPEQERPKLLVYGLSLGSFSGQAAFSGVNDIRRSVDGALFAGTPNVSMPWRQITDNRDEDSPEWQPTYRGGESVRFASNKEDMNRDPEGWTDETRILFLQHANDPVVWFNFDLILNEPDWLTEPRGQAVSPATNWYPFVTFFQVGLDQAIAASAPIGHGHYYIDTPVYAWASVLPPNGWTLEDSQKLQAYINDVHGIQVD